MAAHSSRSLPIPAALALGEAPGGFFAVSLRPYDARLMVGEVLDAMISFSERSTT